MFAFALLVASVVGECTNAQKLKALSGGSCTKPTTECATAVPTFAENCCVSCKPKRAILPSTCMVAEIAACKAKIPTLAPCGDDETPKIENCCVTCRPGLPKSCEGAGKPTPETIAALPSCTPDQSQLNRTDCTLSCVRRQFPKGDESLAKAVDKLKTLKERIEAYKAVCTKEKVEECRAQQEVCSSPEEARFEKTSCCASCVRTRCPTVEAARNCRSEKPVCDFETLFPGRPEEGSCCGSCRITRPAPEKCEPACAAGSVCVWRPEGKGEARTFKAVCRKRRLVKKVLKFVTKAKRDEFKALSKEEKKEWIAAAVEAYCSSAAASDKCKDASASTDAEQTEVTVTDGATDSEANIEVEVGQSADRKRGEEGGDLISEALSDSSNIEATVSDPSAVTPPKGSASSLAASIGLIALSLATLL